MLAERPVTHTTQEIHSQAHTSVSEIVREPPLSPETLRDGPKFLAFMGASGSPKDIGLEVLVSEEGRRGISRRLELGVLPEIRLVPKVTDRPGREIEVSKIPVTEEEFTRLEREGKLVGVYHLASNGCRYAYAVKDFARQGTEEFLVAEPSILHIMELKRLFGDRLHSTFLASTRKYRDMHLHARATESEAEIKRRLDEGDGQTVVAMYLAGKPAKFARRFVSDEIASAFETLLSEDRSAWDTSATYKRLSAKVGPDLMRIFREAVSKNGIVVNDSIEINRSRMLIEDVVVLPEKFDGVWPDHGGVFSETVVDAAARTLLNSESRLLLAEQTADTSVICNLIVPEESRSVRDIFGVPYERMFSEIVGNQDYRTLSIPLAEGLLSADVLWASYRDGNNVIFGLYIQDPVHPENEASFIATKPDGGEDAFLEYRISLPGVANESDRKITQMAFMSKVLELCEQLGVKQFHFVEHVDLVDTDDSVVGIIPSTLAHEDNRYVHRAASVMVWRSHHDEGKNADVKQLFMIRRSMHNKMNPGVWQTAPAGHLMPGETYAEAARRQLKRELGDAFAQSVKKIDPVLQVRIYTSANENPSPQSENYSYFMARVDDNQPSDLSKNNYAADFAAWIDVNTIRRMIEENPAQFRDAFRVAFQAVNWDRVKA